jgi:F0F1-type ATP synthase assembly protein I/preprotein translocase subunit Sss1
MNNYEEMRKIEDDMNNAIQTYQKGIVDYRNQARMFDQCVNEYTKKKADYEAIKRKYETLAGISFLDRMDNYYINSVEAMKKKPTEDEYYVIAKDLRVLEGYRDSSILADECERLAKKTKYESLVRRKNNASSGDEYKQLAREFREIGGYENSSILADECDKLAIMAIKTKYESLVQIKNNTSSINLTTLDKYEQFAREFRKLGGYKNSTQLADECDKQLRVFKEQISEQKRQEEAKKAAEQEAENARIEQERKREKAKEKFKEIAKRFMCTFVPYFIVGMIFYFILFKASDEISMLLIPLIFLGIPLAIINFRDDEWGTLSIIAVIVFWIAILPLTFGYLGLESIGSFGSIAMVVAFIIACKFPTYFWSLFSKEYY